MANDLHRNNDITDGASPHRLVSVADSLELSRARAFWLRLYAGMAGYLIIMPATLVYAAQTSTRPNRAWIVGVAISSLLMMVVTYLLRKKFVTATQRQWVFFVGHTLSFMILVILCAFDGGIDSPIAYLLILPMLSLATGFRFPITLISGVMGLLCYAALLWLAPGRSAPGGMLFPTLTLGVGFLLAILGAYNHDKKNHAVRLLRRRLEMMAMTDELTGCLNQRGFKIELDRKVDRSTRHRHVLSLLLIDIDHFKHINDEHGHLVGDMVLRQVGVVLRATARAADCVGRPGGDELALLAPDTDEAAAMTLAKRLCEDVRVAALPIHVTLSVGICTTSSAPKNSDELFRRADIALYRAKGGGRDQVAVWKDADVLPINAAPTRVNLSEFG